MIAMVGLFVSLFKSIRDVKKGIPNFVSNSFVRLKKMIAIMKADLYNNSKELFLWTVFIS